MKLKILLIISLVFVLPTLIPLFHQGFFPMHDFTHVARMAELDRGLKAGQIPARWSDNFGWGYGMPLMHFYAPLFYYFGELFFLIGIPAVICIKIAIFIAVILGFIFSFKLGEEFFGKWGGLLTAIAFTYAPYRAVQLYVRGALTELLATTFIPLVMLTLYLLIKSSFTKSIKIKTIISFALSLTGIFLSHNVITIIVLPLLFIWGIFWIIYFSITINKRIFKPIGIVVVGGFLAILLSIWFLIPAFFEKDYTIVSTIAGGYSFYKLHFIYFRQLFQTGFRYGGSILGPDDDISFQLGISQLIVLLLAITTYIYVWFRKRRSNTLQVVLFPILLFSLGLFVFIMSFHSTFIWEKIPILQMAQFPWRFLSLNIVILSLLVGFVAFLVNAIKQKPLRLVFGLVLAILLISTNIGFFKPEKYLENNELYYTDSKLIQQHMSGILKDYLPKTAIEQSDSNLSEITLNNQRYDAVDLIKKNGYRSFHIESVKEVKLKIAIYDFIGWKVYLDGKKITHSFDKDTGFIQFNLPSGSHFIEVKITKTPLQLWSDWISFISWLSLGLYVLIQCKNKKL
ncbi:hypothetical protein COX08_02530 [Candidatus Beckwithbacteria bacterium CG23_combo_of_CG06-09_8_20_14_all_34_8]|uniref:Membrane protein 6-pyruvoyl-tetrahydropterin synthase-related domain-containing protein n=1 Tax=Candidatus Beckwithbacteria bacterium CG23_combo_of_CG06-09_8_20_14_all_34_8 TaxID=1974497 RepID=A0A2H0B687_9BACT|nr:MAG: hypothetical protein COX08_02530 [Candidatus Beckwithbacteria bacterium CG23_combo_of_CG06-09_8_20_14_all_34_8]